MADLPAPMRELRAAVDRALADALEDRLARVSALDTQLVPLAEELTDLVLSGGKRLRPVLLLTGHRCAGGEVAAVMGPALALELLHTCALLHDDLIDGAETRRGRPTTHVAFARRHAEEALDGDPEAYGRAVAILLGDLAFVLADDLFCDAQVPAERLLAGLRRFTLLRAEVMAGQYLDVAAARRRSTSRSLVTLVATTKSGRYTIARPLQIGAILAGADRDLLEGLARYGEPLGRAFQVRDDLLGVFGDEAATGKSAASDLREGKRTLLVVEALERLTGAERDEFERRLGDPDLDAGGVARLRSLLESSGAAEATRRQVDAWAAEATAAVADLPVGAQLAAQLEALARFVAARRT